LQHRVLGQRGRPGLVVQCREPARQQAHPALFEKVHRLRRQQADRMRRVAALDRMVDRRHRPALRLVPARGGQVQAGDVLRLLAHQLGAQEVGEKAVVAPLARRAGRFRALADRRDEQVGRVQLGQDARRVAARRQRLAQRGVELAQDAGAQQEVAHLGGLPRQHVLGQEIGDRAVAARELGDEVGHAAQAGDHRVQRHRRQPKRGHPALGLGMQAVDLRRHVGRGAVRRAVGRRPAQRQELPRLVA
jgi:hypothetical protein